MNKADVVQQLKYILVNDLQLNMTTDEIRDDQSLLEDGLALDSIIIEEFIAMVEDRLGLRFDDRILDASLLSDLSKLAGFVAAERVAAGLAS